MKLPHRPLNIFLGTPHNKGAFGNQDGLPRGYFKNPKDTRKQKSNQEKPHIVKFFFKTHFHLQSTSARNLQ